MKPTSRTRARDADRSAAVDVVSAAFADGQLDRAEHDARVARLQQARTFADLDAQLADLQRPGQSLWRPPAVAVTRSRTGGATPGMRAALVACGVALVGGVFVVPALLDDDDEPLTSGLPDVPSAPQAEPILDPLTPQGWDEFVTALKEKTGDTLVIEAYPTRTGVTVVVPVDGHSERVIRYRWAGEWDDGSPSTSSSKPQDLAKIDPEQFAPAMESVSAAIEEPEDQWISVHDVHEGTQRRGCFSAAANNRFGESEMVYFRCDGTRIED